MQVISLFAGIGGFDLAAEWAGWKTVVTCEIAEFPRKVLRYYWPDAYHHDDVKTLTKETIVKNSNWNENEPTIIVGGFPCQPYSAAGKRLGKEDDRHLWPENYRIIREVKPRWVVGENVHGLINWSGGLVFHEVQADLEAAGYEVWPYVLPAVSVNAPHRRDRVWFVARRRDASDTRCKRDGEDGQRRPEQVYEGRPGMEFQNQGEGQRTRSQENVADTNSAGRAEQRKPAAKPGEPQRQHREAYFGSRPAGWHDFPTTEPTIRSGDDGLSDQLDGITFPKWRNESIKAYGNAIAPAVAYQIFKAINEYERLCTGK